MVKMVLRLHLEWTEARGLVCDMTEAGDVTGISQQGALWKGLTSESVGVS